MSWFGPDPMVALTERLAVASERIAVAVEKIANQTGIIGSGLDDVARAITRLTHCVNRPGIPRVVFISEAKERDVKKILFKVVLAPEADATTVKRELSVKVGDLPPAVSEVGVDVLEVDGFKAPEGAAIHIEQVDIDDVGNRSVPAVVEATVQDTFPPAQPGLPSVAATGEVNED
jgi:hypothetical protein